MYLGPQEKYYELEYITPEIEELNWILNDPKIIREYQKTFATVQTNIPLEKYLQNVHHEELDYNRLDYITPKPELKKTKYNATYTTNNGSTLSVKDILPAKSNKSAPKKIRKLPEKKLPDVPVTDIELPFTLPKKGYWIIAGSDDMRAEGFVPGWSDAQAPELILEKSIVVDTTKTEIEIGFFIDTNQIRYHLEHITTAILKERTKLLWFVTDNLSIIEYKKYNFTTSTGIPLIKYLTQIYQEKFDPTRLYNKTRLSPESIIEQMATYQTMKGVIINVRGKHAASPKELRWYDTNTYAQIYPFNANCLLLNEETIIATKNKIPVRTGIYSNNNNQKTNVIELLPSTALYKKRKMAKETSSSTLSSSTTSDLNETFKPIPNSSPLLFSPSSLPPLKDQPIIPVANDKQQLPLPANPMTPIIIPHVIALTPATSTSPEIPSAPALIATPAKIPKPS